MASEPTAKVQRAGSTSEKASRILPQRDTADVIVIGAGPAGSTAAFYLAQAGLDVLILEKETFPREKVCGDGLTPRAVKCLLAMGIDLAADKGWVKTTGLRFRHDGQHIDYPWPDMVSFPNYGLVRSRRDFDHILAKRACAIGARLQEGIHVEGPMLDDHGQVIGVIGHSGPDKTPVTYRAQLVIAANGASGRIEAAIGLHDRPDRPIGVAARDYFRSSRHDITHLEASLDLRDGDDLLAGYGWIFGMGDGTCNVGVGLFNSGRSVSHLNIRKVFHDWAATLPKEWGITPANSVGAMRSGPLPMGLNRTPLYTRGMMLAGDSGGLINPFNGEGISYAMESAELAADFCIQALARPDRASADRVLQAYPQEIKRRYGGYFQLGLRAAQLISHPEIMRFAAKYGLRRATVVAFFAKLFSHSIEPQGGDFTDRAIMAFSRIVPSA